ncbi:hypothetical protein Dda_2409 [Drechslerella dactyloides]|uniref:Uncharacterized protein n=1 Tax=Drechslerella dactyloides TaxID=74499 RepID=A0AAD6J4V1_DREDA|nr:hypothetical protein Dda_2409 [Drechslerella dactyloides]
MASEKAATAPTEVVRDFTPLEGFSLLEEQLLRPTIPFKLLPPRRKTTTGFTDFVNSLLGLEIDKIIFANTTAAGINGPICLTNPGLQLRYHLHYMTLGSRLKEWQEEFPRFDCIIQEMIPDKIIGQLYGHEDPAKRQKRLEENIQAMNKELEGIVRRDFLTVLQRFDGTLPTAKAKRNAVFSGVPEGNLRLSLEVVGNVLAQLSQHQEADRLKVMPHGGMQVDGPAEGAETKSSPRKSVSTKKKIFPVTWVTGRRLTLNRPSNKKVVVIPKLSLLQHYHSTFVIKSIRSDDPLKAAATMQNTGDRLVLPAPIPGPDYISDEQVENFRRILAKYRDERTWINEIRNPSSDSVMIYDPFRNCVTTTMYDLSQDVRPYIRYDGSGRLHDLAYDLCPYAWNVFFTAGEPDERNRLLRQTVDKIDGITTDFYNVVARIQEDRREC